jgi:hypothetical protein
VTTSLRNVIETTRYYVQGTNRGARNELGTAYAAGDTSLIMGRPIESIAPGSIVEVDLEQFYVWGTNNSAKSLDVSGRQNGTDNADHEAGVMAFVNPEVTAEQIRHEVNVELAALSSRANGLFSVTTIPLTFNPAIAGYDLGSENPIIDVLEVKYEIPGPSLLWPIIPRRLWRVKRNSDTTDFGSGTALVLYDGGSAGRTIQVTVAQQFGQTLNLGDDVTDTGLPTSAIDILSIGAAARILAAREGQRT